MQAANLFVHNISSFRGFRKIILGVIRKWSSETALNFEFYTIDWHPRLTRSLQFLSVTLPMMEINPPSILPSGKKSRSPRPLTIPWISKGCHFPVCHQNKLSKF